MQKTKTGWANPLVKTKNRPQYGNGNIPPFHISTNMLPLTQGKRLAILNQKQSEAKSQGSEVFLTRNSEVIFAKCYSVSARTHADSLCPFHTVTLFVTDFTRVIIY